MRTFSSMEEKNRWLALKRSEMEAEGMSEDEKEEKIDALAETNWTQEEWNSYYGGRQDDW